MTSVTAGSRVRTGDAERRPAIAPGAGGATRREAGRLESDRPRSGDHPGAYVLVDAFDCAGAAHVCSDHSIRT